MKPEKLNSEIKHEDIQACNQRALEDFTASINNNYFESVRGITDVVRKLAEPMEKFSNSPMMDTLTRFNESLSSQVKQINLSGVERVAEAVRSMTESVPDTNRILGVTDVVKRFAEQQEEILGNYKGMISGLDQIAVPQVAHIREIQPHYDNSAFIEHFKQEAEDKATQRVANEKIIELHDELVATTKAMEKSVEIQHIQFQVMQALLDEQKASRIDGIKRDEENKADSKKNFKLNIVVLIVAVLGLLTPFLQKESKTMPEKNVEKAVVVVSPSIQVIEIPFLPNSK